MSAVRAIAPPVGGVDTYRHESGFASALLPAAIVAIATALVYPDRSQAGVPIVVGLIVGSFLLLRDSLVWALAPMLILEFTDSYYLLPGISVSGRLALDLILLLVSASAIRARARLDDPIVKRVLLPALIFVALATIENALTSDIDYVFKYFRYQFTLLAALLIFASAVRSRQDVVKLAILAGVLGSAVGIAAIWQHYSVASAPYVAASADTVSGWDGRSVGLSDSPVSLAALLPSVLVPVLGFLLTRQSRGDRLRTALIIAALAMLAGTYLTYTRSALIALDGGLLAMGLLLRGRPRTIALGAAIGAVVLFELLQGTGLINARYYSLDDSSAQGHQALWTADLAIALQQPLLGIGSENYQTVAAGYATNAQTQVGTSDQAGLASVGKEQPHNDFLYVWISWGLPGAVAYVLMIVGAYRNFASGARSTDRLLRGLAIGAAAGLVAYAIGSAFHNFLDSTTVLWMFAGLSIALARLVSYRGARRAPVLRRVRAAPRRLAVGWE